MPGYLEMVTHTKACMLRHAQMEAKGRKIT